MTRIINIASEAVVRASAALAAEVMQGGGIVLYPTDTTYALGVNALNLDAVDRVFQLKGRDYSKPIHVIVRDLEQAAEYVMVNDLAHKIVKQFLPGALTLVLDYKTDAKIPPLLVAGGSTLGIRVPDHPICRELSAITAFPITTTSANRSQMPNTYSVDTVAAQLGDDFEGIDLVLDGGTLEGGVSTVIGIQDSSVQVFREGVIPSSAILEFAEQTRRKA